MEFFYIRSEVKNASIKHRCKQGRLKSRANGQPLLHTKYVRFCFHSKTQTLRIWKSADLFVAAHHYSGAQQEHALTIILSISFRKKTCQKKSSSSRGYSEFRRNKNDLSCSEPVSWREEKSSWKQGSYKLDKLGLILGSWVLKHSAVYSPSIRSWGKTTAQN